MVDLQDIENRGDEEVLQLESALLAGVWHYSMTMGQYQPCRYSRTRETHCQFLCVGKQPKVMVKKTAMYEIPQSHDAVLTKVLCHVPMVIRVKKHSIVPLRDHSNAVYEYQAVSWSLDPSIYSRRSLSDSTFLGQLGASSKSICGEDVPPSFSTKDASRLVPRKSATCQCHASGRQRELSYRSNAPSTHPWHRRSEPASRRSHLPETLECRQT